MRRRDRVELKTPEQVVAMRRAGLVVADALAAVRAAARPGLTTAELDAVAALDARPAPGEDVLLRVDHTRLAAMPLP